MGVLGEDLSTLLSVDSASFTDVPGGSVAWTFAGNNDYNPTCGTVPIVITPADASITVTGYTGVYDGNDHGAWGIATGVQDEDLSSLLNLGASFTDGPGGTANWTFAGTTDYNPATGTVTIVITPADATITVTGYTGVYDGLAHGAWGMAIGISSEDLSSLLDLGPSFSDAPGGTANWAFAGNNDYNAASGSVPIVITKADAVINVSGCTTVYDGWAYQAWGLATGVQGEDLSSLLNLGPSFTDVPGGTANWTFAGNNDYNAASGSVLIVITEASLTITADDASKNYGDTLSFAGTEFSARVLVGSDTVSSVTLTSDGVPASADLGNYDIVPSAALGSGLANYAINYVNGTLSVVDPSQQSNCDTLT